MPSPNNITELIIFVGGAIIFTIACLIASRFTRFGRKLTGDWKPGPIQFHPDEITPRRREKYVDPLGKLNPAYAVGISLVFMVLAFVFWIFTKQGLQAGN